MAETFVNVTEGSGKKLHAWDRTIGANTVLDEFMLPGEYPLACYTVVTAAVSGATSADHIIQVMAGASLNVRIRRIQIWQVAPITAAAEWAVDLLRLTTAGTGGTATTFRPFDTADAAAGATAMTLPTAKGTEGVQLDTFRIYPIQTNPTSGQTMNGPFAEWVQLPNMKPILIPAGTANGICLKIQTGRAGLTVQSQVDIVETSFV